MSIIRIHYHDNEELIPLSELNLHPEMIELLEELGVVETRGEYIPVDYAWRLRKMLRLKSCLGVNLNGAAIIVDLLERIEELESEIKRLQKTR